MPLHCRQATKHLSMLLATASLSVTICFVVKLDDLEQWLSVGGMQVSGVLVQDDHPRDASPTLLSLSLVDIT